MPCESTTKERVFWGFNGTVWEWEILGFGCYDMEKIFIFCLRSNTSYLSCNPCKPFVVCNFPYSLSWYMPPQIAWWREPVITLVALFGFPRLPLALCVLMVKLNKEHWLGGEFQLQSEFHKAAHATQQHFLQSIKLHPLRWVPFVLADLSFCLGGFTLNCKL